MRDSRRANSRAATIEDQTSVVWGCADRPQRLALMSLITSSVSTVIVITPYSRAQKCRLQLGSRPRLPWQMPYQDPWLTHLLSKCTIYLTSWSPPCHYQNGDPRRLVARDRLRALSNSVSMSTFIPHDYVRSAALPMTAWLAWTFITVVIRGLWIRAPPLDPCPTGADGSAGVQVLVHFTASTASSPTQPRLTHRVTQEL